MVRNLLRCFSASYGLSKCLALAGMNGTENH